MKEEFFAVAFRRTFYESVDQLQRDLDRYLEFYHRERAHQDYRTKGRTPFGRIGDVRSFAGRKWTVLRVILALVVGYLGVRALVALVVRDTHPLSVFPHIVLFWPAFVAYHAKTGTSEP